MQGMSLWISVCFIFMACFAALAAEEGKKGKGTTSTSKNTQIVDLKSDPKDHTSLGPNQDVLANLKVQTDTRHGKPLRRVKRKRAKHAPKKKSTKLRRRNPKQTVDSPASEAPKLDVKLEETPVERRKEQQSDNPVVPNWVPVLGKRACGKCMWQECQPIDVMKRHCPSGIIRDQCNCCAVCASGSRMPCYLTSFAPMWLPLCGDDLECVPIQGEGDFDMHVDPDAWGGKRELEGQCTCIERTSVCGSNNQTYDNICEFRELSARWSYHSGMPVMVLHPGPCNAAPKLDRGPEDLVAKVGEVVSFRCETSGFPLPRIQWFKQKGDRPDEFDGVRMDPSPEMELPGYLNHAVTQMRGGPGKYQITTWLTLDKVSSADQGVYFCRMTNADGVVDGSASLKVTGA